MTGLKAHAAKLSDTEINATDNYFKIQTSNLFLWVNGC